MVRIYREFWAKALDAYVEKYQDKYVFLFTDLKTKKRIRAGSAKKKRLEFDDIDYGLERVSAFKQVALNSESVRIRPLTARHKKAVKAFSKQCSTDDWDTLDLTFKGEYVLGLLEGKKILGIARYAKIRRHPKLVDVTVLLAPSARGRGYSTPLVSKLIERILARGLCPKYRVRKTNSASRAIAEALGLVPLFSLSTYSIS